MPNSSGFRAAAVSLVLGLLGVGVVLSVRTHYYPRFGYGLGIYNAQLAAIAGLVAYAAAVGATWLGRRWKNSTRRNLCVPVLALLGIEALYQGPEQLARVGFAASNRTPDPAAVGLAIAAGALALWQIGNLFWGGRLLPNSIVVSALVFLNVYLFFAAW